MKSVPNTHSSSMHCSQFIALQKVNWSWCVTVFLSKHKRAWSSKRSWSWAKPILLPQFVVWSSQVGKITLSLKWCECWRDLGCLNRTYVCRISRQQVNILCEGCFNGSKVARKRLLGCCSRGCEWCWRTVILYYEWFLLPITLILWRWKVNWKLKREQSTYGFHT